MTPQQVSDGLCQVDGNHSKKLNAKSDIGPKFVVLIELGDNCCII
jgi:hypothetical protein